MSSSRVRWIKPPPAQNLFWCEIEEGQWFTRPEDNILRLKINVSEYRAFGEPGVEGLYRWNSLPTGRALRRVQVNFECKLIE